MGSRDHSQILDSVKMHLFFDRLAFAYLEHFSTSSPRLSVAVTLTHLLAGLVDQSQTSELKPLIGGQ